jgi:hypothetical protein
MVVMQNSIKKRSSSISLTPYNYNKLISLYKETASTKINTVT